DPDDVGPFRCALLRRLSAGDDAELRPRGLGLARSGKHRVVVAARLGELGGDSGEERLRVDLVAALLRRAREPATRPLRKSSSASRPTLPPSTGRPPWATARPRPPASALTSVVGD